MNTELSTDTDKKRGYFICPKCGSKEILYESNWFDSDNNQLKVIACCEKCGKEWYELYGLIPQEITFETEKNKQERKYNGRKSNKYKHG